MKTPKVKKRGVSLHSRAARRGEAPPSKDLAVKTPAVEETDYKPWLHNAQNAGVGKKRKVKQLSRQQKERQQKALEKADANVDKLERKVADSKMRAKKVQARAKDWEELNQEKPAGKEVKGVEKTAKAASESKAQNGGDEKAMEGVELLEPQQQVLAKEPDFTGAGNAHVVEPTATAAAATTEDLDEVT